MANRGASRKGRAPAAPRAGGGKGSLVPVPSLGVCLDEARAHAVLRVLEVLRVDIVDAPAVRFLHQVERRVAERFVHHADVVEADGRNGRMSAGHARVDRRAQLHKILALTHRVPVEHADVAFRREALVLGQQRQHRSVVDFALPFDVVHLAAVGIAGVEPFDEGLGVLAIAGEGGGREQSGANNRLREADCHAGSSVFSGAFDAAGAFALGLRLGFAAFATGAAPLTGFALASAFGFAAARLRDGFLPGPFATRASIKATASSSVTAIGSMPLGNVALTVPSAT